MQTPMISATKMASGSYSVHASGCYGGGYTCPCTTAEQAAAMVVRDTPRYDREDTPIRVILDPEVSAAVKVLLAEGEQLTACLTCQLRPIAEQKVAP